MMTTHTQPLVRVNLLSAWIDALPPLLPPVTEVPEEPASSSFGDEGLVVVAAPSGFWSWLLALLPIGENISREEAAKFILTREIRVKYTPLIVELDRQPHPPDLEIR
jgi:hypothetical protein